MSMAYTDRDTGAPVLGVTLSGSHEAAAYYRLRVPLESAFDAVDFVTLGQDGIGLSALAALGRGRRLIVLSRVMLQDRPGASVVDALAALRAGGARVVVDQDDDLLARPNLRRHMTARGQASYESFLRQADGRACTSRTLQGRFRRYGATAIIPNYIRPDWTPPQPHPAGDGPTVITLTGSASHADDWRQAAAALRAIRADYGDAVRVRVAGAMMPYLSDIADEHLPWGGRLAAYPAMLAGTHIGLCPLPDGSFNRCKSPIKCYEFALAGAAVIGSPTQYGPALGDGRGIVVPDGGDWGAAIRAYLDDPARRARDAAALQAHIVAALDARQHAAQIRAAYLGG